MLSTEFDKFYSKEADSTLFNNALQYLKGFEAPVAAASLELNIQAQDENARNSDKKLKKLRDEAINLEKDKVRLEEKIAQRKKEIEKEEIELAKQKELLDGLLKQRKNIL
jgi:chromosome segregation ATPase